MADAKDGGAAHTPKPFVPGPAADSMVSLSQAILAPLDAIAKAQVHAARSFLNFVLQIGYPHRSGGGGGTEPAADESMYNQTFRFEQVVADADGKPVKRQIMVNVPTLALVPVQPLGIDSATYDIELVVRELERHRQIQASEAEALKKEAPHQAADGAVIDPELKPRPWFLVPEPVSVRGTLSDPGGTESGTQKQASIKVHVEVRSVPVPAGLAKLVSAMTQLSGMNEATLPPPPPPPPAAPAAGNSPPPVN